MDRVSASLNLESALPARGDRSMTTNVQAGAISPDLVENGTSETFWSTSGGHYARHADVPSILSGGRLSPIAPLVSIVIPTFRRPRLLADAIRSALAQTGFSDFEVVVVDNDAEAPADGEVAQLIASLAHPRLAYYRNARNLGATGNLNRSNELGRGRYVCQLHDDDWLSPQFLSRLTARIPADAEFISAEIVIGTEDYRPDFGWAAVDGAPRVRRLSKLDAIHAITTIAPALVGRQALTETGGHEEAAFPVDDYVLFMQLVSRGKAYKVPERLSYYRTTDSVTFTGNVLERQIAGSLAVKRRTLPEVPGVLGPLYYVESARRQFERVHEAGKDPAPFLAGRADRVAEWLSRHPVARSVFAGAMRGVRGLSSLSKRA